MTNAAKPTRQETSTTGKGMPRKIPQDNGPPVDKAQAPRDASVESSLALPHERDQSTNMTPGTIDPKIRQAERDVNCGLQDTSKALEADRTYQKQKEVSVKAEP